MTEAAAKRALEAMVTRDTVGAYRVRVLREERVSKCAPTNISPSIHRNENTGQLRIVGFVSSLADVGNPIYLLHLSFHRTWICMKTGLIPV